MFDRLMTMKSLTTLISFHFDSDPRPQVPEPMSLFLPALVLWAGRVYGRTLQSVRNDCVFRRGQW